MHVGHCAPSHSLSLSLVRPTSESTQRSHIHILKMKGYVLKQGTSASSWRRRYCVVSSSGLTYSKSSSSTKPQGILPASRIQSVRVCPSDPLVFLVEVSNARTYAFRTADGPAPWIESLLSILNKRPPQLSPILPSSPSTVLVPSSPLTTLTPPLRHVLPTSRRVSPHDASRYCAWLNSLNVWKPIAPSSLASSLRNGLLLCRLVSRLASPHNVAYVLRHVHERPTSEALASSNLRQSLHAIRVHDVRPSFVPDAPKLLTGKDTASSILLLREVCHVFAVRPAYRALRVALSWFDTILRASDRPLSASAKRGDGASLWSAFRDGTAFAYVLFWFCGAQGVPEEGLPGVDVDALTKGSNVRRVVSAVLSSLREAGVEVVWTADEFLSFPNDDFLVLQLWNVHRRFRFCQRFTVSSSVSSSMSSPVSSPAARLDTIARSLPPRDEIRARVERERRERLMIRMRRVGMLSPKASPVASSVEARERGRESPDVVRQSPNVVRQSPSPTVERELFDAQRRVIEKEEEIAMIEMDASKQRRRDHLRTRIDELTRLKTRRDSLVEALKRRDAVVDKKERRAIIRWLGAAKVVTLDDEPALLSLRRVASDGTLRPVRASLADPLVLTWSHADTPNVEIGRVATTALHPVTAPKGRALTLESDDVSATFTFEHDGLASWYAEGLRAIVGS